MSDYHEAKIAELMAERFKLHEAMMRAREILHNAPVDASAAFRARSAYHVLGRALGIDGKEDRDDDFEAQRRLAEQSAARD